MIFCKEGESSLNFWPCLKVHVVVLGVTFNDTNSNLNYMFELLHTGDHAILLSIQSLQTVI